MRHRLARLLLIILIAAGNAVAATDRSEAPLLLGVFPYLPPARLERLYAPVAASLSQAIDRPIQLRTRPDFRSFSEEIKRQSYDLIFIQPFDYARLAAQHGYRALARPGKPLSAILVTRTESAIHSLDDLRGKPVATPPTRAAVSILGLKMLIGHGLKPGDDVRLIPRKSHLACIHMALTGKASACVTAPSPLSVFTGDSGIQFRVIATSNPVPASTFALHHRIAPSTREALLSQILNWDKHASGRKILNTLHHSPFIASHDEDYDPVRRILHDTRTFREAPTQDGTPDH